MARGTVFAMSAWLVTSTLASTTASKTHCPVFYPRDNPPVDCLHETPSSFLPFQTSPELATSDSGFNTTALEDAFAALTVMQGEYFSADQGTWLEAIDWTAAVMQTVLSGTLTSLSTAFSDLGLTSNKDRVAKRNLVDTYFTQTVSSYFGQDALSIRNQAYDDILWVVLGWLEAIKFTHVHSELHYPPRDPERIADPDLWEALRSNPWHGFVWVPAFAHRARIFWDSATSGWSDALCNGGMTWNPRLEPYKNAVTNELWIAASISMYLWFPGDNNTSPWVNGHFLPSSTREPRYLAAAIQGYKWLKEVNMTNDAGLFVDGFHVSPASKRGSKKCDVRNEMVYTYNQGIVLTGQRGLWTATGSPSYLEDGHGLIQAVIKATGWDLKKNEPVDDLSKLRPGTLPQWRGIGRGGILEEQCDASGTCSQDGQTFKGIFFHHLVSFCEALQPPDLENNIVFDSGRHDQIRSAHSSACRSYKKWVTHNAQAALLTRDERGRFGSWWGAELFNHVDATEKTDGIPHDAANTTDYRNGGIPTGRLWRGGNPANAWAPNGAAFESNAKSRVLGGTIESDQHVLGAFEPPDHLQAGQAIPRKKDLNDRGRGRTAETHNGGLALMRAWWEFVVASEH
ncbi:glycosyl hydrolase family 76-domain-containing protein [Plectosphaerella plurivora]|uniref:Glycosyl hydrolase family 76-domain-containing protein n=1 Tax=Plectosphaerella plurivora TaxID=936078 RepID=A0A9P9ABD7_9PEZI|nr:glycosyl hydrolase family 76-domain-containing protein [Plectosphaerella plurivora]